MNDADRHRLGDLAAVATWWTSCHNGEHPDPVVGETLGIVVDDAATTDRHDEQSVRAAAVAAAAIAAMTGENAAAVTDLVIDPTGRIDYPATTAATDAIREAWFELRQVRTEPAALVDSLPASLQARVGALEQASSRSPALLYGGLLTTAAAMAWIGTEPARAQGIRPLSRGGSVAEQIGNDYLLFAPIVRLESRVPPDRLVDIALATIRASHS